MVCVLYLSNGKNIKCCYDVMQGCISTHSNLAHYAAAKAKAHSISSSDIVFVASSHTFDPSLGDFVSAWFDQRPQPCQSSCPGWFAYILPCFVPHFV